MRTGRSKDLPKALRLLERGILAAQVSQETSEEKAMHFNLASFCWPGWDEPGITIQPDQLELGERAAEENLRLAIALEKPPAAVANAHWMIGAYHLVRGRSAEAIESFAEQERFAKEAGDLPAAAMARAYAGLAKRQAGESLRVELILERLQFEEGGEYADQIVTAAGVFAPPAPDVVVERLTPEVFRQEIDRLAVILARCVQDGASLNFVLPYSVDDARAFWTSLIPSVERGERILFVARRRGEVTGTAQLIPAPQPNQPHRADVAKMMVDPDHRRKGIARNLLAAVEATALEMDRTLLTLDTAAGDPSEQLYPAVGYARLGTVPDYALAPDGERLVAATFFYKHLKADH